jgi:metal-sulfur cluster biosynthetic enzyme
MNTTTPLTDDLVLETLRQVIDPEINCNIVDLGLIYSVAHADGRLMVTMTLTTPGCPMHDSIAEGVKNILLTLDGVTNVEVEVVWDPPWHPSMMTEAGRAMTGVRND